MNLLNLLSSLPHDKAGHLIAGVLLYAAFHFVHPAVGIAVVVIAAVAKEVYDYLHKETHTPETMDAVATIVGGIVGFICSL